MKLLFTNYDITQVFLAKGLLESNDIPCIVKNEYLQGGIGELPVSDPELWLLDEGMLGQAQAVLKDFKL
jgi:hypothetical protein